MPNNTKRLAILSQDEVRELFGLPNFIHEERDIYFSLDPDESLIFESLRQTNAKLLFLIQLGYFKVSHQFFVFTWNDVLADRDYLLARYFPHEAAGAIPSKNTRLTQQKMILQCQRYRLFGKEEYKFLTHKTGKLTKLHAQPRFLLTELLRILDTEQITMPGYSTFQKIIGAATSNGQKRLNACIRQQVPENIKSELNDLLTMDGQFYQLTALKKRAKDFRLNQSRQEIQKHVSTNHLYEFAREFLPKLEVSNENVKYYASLAEYYPVHRQQLRQTGKLVQLFVDESIDDGLPFRDIKVVAFEIADETQIKQMVDYLVGKKLNHLHYEWNHIQQISRKIAVNIRPLFMAIDFSGTLDDDPLIEAISLLKSAFKSGKPALSLKLQTKLATIIPNNLKPWITTLPHCEFFIYQQIKNGLEAGDIFFSGSTRFKSFDEDLVSKQEMKDKQHLLEALGFPMLNLTISERLADLKTKLEQRYSEVNANILSGKNPHLKFSQKNNEIHWTLPYKKQEDNVNNPFYEQLPQEEIINVLRYVNEQCGFMEAFEHIQSRYAKSQADKVNLMASIMSYGERIGLATMADISDIKAHLLRTTSKNYMRLENARKANDIIANATAMLPIFQHYNLEIGTLHASADGQKIEAQRATFKARYSKKYFGLSKGLVNFTMVVNHVPANAKLIGANEHESHYAVDIVFNNTSEIDPDVISVDMAGTNQVNFVLMETFGRTWAPRSGQSRLNYADDTK